MSAAVLPSEVSARNSAAALEGIRARGRVHARFRQLDGHTRLARLAEAGGYRMLLPNSHSARAEAVLINTGGGVVGGDRVSFQIEAEGHTDVVVTTQAAERIYRSDGPSSALAVRLNADAGARLAWVPQETILFSSARLERGIEVDLADGASVLLAESTVFGRIASSEELRGGRLRDHWRVRRAGRLIFAESSRLDDVSTASLGRPAVLDGAAAAALLLLVGPDAEARMTAMREAMLDSRSAIGASAWNGMLTLRCIAAAPEDMRRDLKRAIAVALGAPLPRVWSM